MSVILNCILAFYPTALIWAAIPSSYLKKIDSFGTTPLMHFIVHLVIFVIIFFICYKVIDKFLSRSHTRGGALSYILAVISFVLLFLFSFYQILPGEVLYKTPPLVDEYVLKNPYSFLALILPLIYLFFE